MTTIDRLRELEQAATPGPWEQHMGCIINVLPDESGRDLGDFRESQRPDGDAALIAEARNHMGALLDVAQAARSLRPDDLRYVAVDGIEYPPDSGEARARKFRAALARLEA